MTHLIQQRDDLLSAAEWLLLALQEAGLDKHMSIIDEVNGLKDAVRQVTESTTLAQHLQEKEAL